MFNGAGGCQGLYTMQSNGIRLITWMLLAAFLTTAASAATPAGATINSTTDLGRVPTPAPGTVDVVAGNITVVNLDVQQSTFRWVGLLGNITGSIVLGDSDSNVIYQWAARGNLVYASASSSVDWSSLTNANESDVAGFAAFVGGSSNDAYNNTFTEPPELIDSNIFSITSEYALTNSANATVWKTYSLHDTADLVWVGLVVENGTSYRNSTVDYQMIIPEDGTGGNTVPTTYYLWVENL